MHDTNRIIKHFKGAKWIPVQNMKLMLVQFTGVPFYFLEFWAPILAI